MNEQLSLFDTIIPKKVQPQTLTIDVTNPKNIQPFYQNLTKYPLAYADREFKIKRSADDMILISPKIINDMPAIVISSISRTYCAIWKDTFFEVQNYKHQQLKPFKAISEKTYTTLSQLFEDYADDINTLFLPCPTEEIIPKEPNWPSKKTIDDQLTTFFTKHQTNKEKTWRIKQKTTYYTVYQHDGIIEIYRKKTQKPKRLIAILSKQGSFTTDDFNPESDQFILCQ